MGPRIVCLLVAAVLIGWAAGDGVASPVQRGSLVFGLGVDGAAFWPEDFYFRHYTVVPHFTEGYQLGSKVRVEIQAEWWQRRWDDRTFYENNEVKVTAWNAMAGLCCHPWQRFDGFLLRGSLGVGQWESQSTYGPGGEATGFAFAIGSGYEFHVGNGVLAGPRLDYCRQRRDLCKLSVGLALGWY